jgi:hypothetical protein
VNAVKEEISDYSRNSNPISSRSVVSILTGLLGPLRKRSTRDL